MSGTYFAPDRRAATMRAGLAVIIARALDRRRRLAALDHRRAPIAAGLLALATAASSSPAACRFWGGRL
jgi:hypothetical protein